MITVVVLAILSFYVNIFLAIWWHFERLRRKLYQEDRKWWMGQCDEWQKLCKDIMADRGRDPQLNILEKP